MSETPQTIGAPGIRRRKPEAGGETAREQTANVRLALYCRALAHPVRVRILKLLIREHCMFGDVSRRIPLAQSTISQHLKILAEAGLVEAAADGQSVCYCVRDKEIRNLKKVIADL